ncbi:5' exonuclease Apollo isoform 2-T3 [Pholidichthys leucotaenia]
MWRSSSSTLSLSQMTDLTLSLKVKEEWIHPLELGPPHLLPLDDIGKEKLTVTLMDANHCPGAAMFLFEGYFGSILYTGDFRYTPLMLREPCLRNNIVIDVLYLDNTNCDPNRTLPSRQRATQQIKEIIRSHPNHNVVIGLYALGKESLLLDLAVEFRTWVEVSFERMEILRALELPDVFTTEPGAGRIRVVDQSEVCSAALHQWNKEQPTLAILPTSRPLISFHPSVHVVPYSDHSSYQELEDFVSALKPNSIVPIVGRNCVPGSLSALLPRKRCHEIFVPESVRHYMLRQPEMKLCSTECTGLPRRHVYPLAPKGVIFESPMKGAVMPCEDVWEAESLDQDGSEGDADSEIGEKDSDCIVQDLNKTFTSNDKRRRGGNVWSNDINQTVSAEVVMAESMELSQLVQSRCASAEIPTSEKVCSEPVQTTRRHSKTSTKAVNIHHNRQENILNNHVLSEGENASQGSGSEPNDDVTVFQNGFDNSSCSSPRSSTPLPYEYIEELENRLLENLPFSEEDFESGGLLPPSFVQQLLSCP